MDFVALDFETANEKRNSPCSIGLTVVKENQIVEERYFLIKPKEMRFVPMNIMIHGIRPDDVKDAMEFDQLWPTLLPYLEKQFVVAHNASFDFSVLRSTLDLYHIPYPNLTYGCTMLMAKQFYPFLANAKLNTVSDFLSYEFNHHHASADAAACATVFLNILNELQLETKEELETSLGIAFGRLFPGGYQPCRKVSSSIVSKKTAAPVEKKRILESNQLSNKVVALTGPLRSMTRPEAISVIHRLGGTYRSSVTKKTNVLITNVTNVEKLSPSQMSRKLARALELKRAGQEIEIYSEDIFYSDHII